MGMWHPETSLVFLVALEMVLEKAFETVVMVIVSFELQYTGVSINGRPQIGWFTRGNPSINGWFRDLETAATATQVSCGLNSSQCATQPLAQCARAPMSLGPAGEGQTLEYLDCT